MTTNENQATATTEIRGVVAGVDGSDSALHAVLWAAREAESRGVPLTVVNALHLPEAAVAPYEPEDFAARQQAAGSALVETVAAGIRDEYPGLTVETRISPSSPTHLLAELSAPEVLVVTGTRGHGGFAGMLLGSVSRALATHADGPLVVVRGPEPEQANGAVVLGVGPTPAASAVEFAFAAARRYGAPLRVLRAWMPPMPMAGFGMPGGTGLGGPGILSTPESFDSDTEEAADATRAIEPVSARYPEVKVEVGAAMGNAVPVLTEAGADARLIVVGAHRHRGPFSVGAGYVVEGLLAHSPVPVAVIPVRAGRDEADGRLEG